MAQHNLASSGDESNLPTTPLHEDEFDEIRSLILGEDQARLNELDAQLSHIQTSMESLHGRINDEDALADAITPIIADSIGTSIRNSRGEMVEVISPIMADTIRTNIRDSKDEMVEALYPIIGQLIQRAVAEAVKDLVSRIDSQIQRAFSYRSVWRHIQARLQGVSPGELALREALPFRATDAFLIHHETGLLLAYLGEDAIGSADYSLYETVSEGDTHTVQPVTVVDDSDQDMISGMLTAIRDFVGDAFGRGEEGTLDQITYGDRQIFIETARYAYIAVVLEGTQPPGMRSHMRHYLMQIENDYYDTLRSFDGNIAKFESAQSLLRTLMDSRSYQESIPDNITLSKEDDSSLALAPSEDKYVDEKKVGQPGSSLPSPITILFFINLLIFIIWLLFVS